MTKLEQLIQDLCPNGVKMVKLGDVANIQYGFPFNASLFTDEKNEKPIIRIRDIVPAQTSTYYSGTVEGLDNYIIHRGDILLGMDGYFNMEKWDSEDAYLNQRVCKISTKNKDIVLEGFLFHYLRPQFKKIEQTTAGGSVIHLSAKIINNLQIPLPPLAVQSEIVRLLDKFTLYMSELAAELAARCKQYEHYRDQLLTFDDTVKRVKLGEVGKMQYGYPFNASLFTDEKNDKPIIRIRDVVPAYANTYYNGNVDDLENYIIRRGDMLVGMDGYFNMAKWNDDNAYLNQRVCKISTANSKVVLDGFLFHFLKPTFKIIEQNTAGGSVIHLSAKVINNILIPLPPLSEQERIVSILDRFDKLCHDIREGLPAEIELRQKQYEYYRDKLLTFG